MIIMKMITVRHNYTHKCLCNLITYFHTNYNICILYIIMSELPQDEEFKVCELEEAVKKIVFHNIEKEDNENVCSICMDSLDNKPSLIMTTECGHKFHYRDCWKKYYEQSKNNCICKPCPMCRKLVMFENGNFFDTMEYIKNLEELIIESIDEDFNPLFYEVENPDTSNIEDISIFLPNIILRNSEENEE